MALIPIYFPDPRDTWRVERLRVHFLIKAGEKHIAEARERAIAIVKERNADLAVVGDLVQAFHGAGRAAEAIEILELARSLKGSEVLDTWLVAVLARKDDDDSAQRARSLADELGRANLSLAKSAAALRGMQGDAGVLRQYLDTRIESSDKARTEHRFLRLRLNFADATGRDGDARTKARATSVADLSAIAADPDASPRVLETCVAIAYALDEFDSAGRCLAAAAGRSDSISVMPIRLLATFESGQIPVAQRAKLLAGLTERGESMPARAFLNALAASLRPEAIDVAKLRSALAELAEDAASEVPARFMALSLAARADDLEAVESQARALLARLPDAVELRAGLAALFLRADRPKDALDLYPDRSALDATGAALVARSLMVLDERDAARSVLTDSIRRHPQDARAFLLLAALIREDESRAGRILEALRVLSAAPAVRPVQLMRAELLLHDEVGLSERAARIYIGLLNRNLLDRAALTGYLNFLMTRDRKGDAIQLCSFLLNPNQESVPGLRNQFDGLMASPEALQALRRLAAEQDNGAVRTGWRIVRATASQQSGRVREALDDYRHVNKHTSGILAPLNNGAWILAEMARAEIERAPEEAPLSKQVTDDLNAARAWVEEALALLPEEPRTVAARERSASVQDTAAYVYLLLREYELAKTAIDKAIGYNAAVGDYRLRRARILWAAGDADGARAEVERVIADFAGQPAEREAVILRRKFGPQ